MLVKVGRLLLAPETLLLDELAVGPLVFFGDAGVSNGLDSHGGYDKEPLLPVYQP